MREAAGADPTALQNLVNALNANPYANATFTEAVQRGDFVGTVARRCIRVVT